MQPGESKELSELIEKIVVEHKLRWFGLVNAHILPRDLRNQINWCYAVLGEY